MIYPPIAKLVEKTKTRYSLVILTARRARQLGAENGGEFSGRFDEAILKSIDEIYEGKVSARPKNYYFDYVNAVEMPQESGEAASAMPEDDSEK